MVLAAVDAAPAISNSDLATLAPATAAWVASDVERHTMATNGETTTSLNVAVINSRGTIIVYGPQRGVERHMPLPPGFTAARYIDIRMSFLTSAFNDVAALTDAGAIVVARGTVNAPDGRVYSPLAVIDGSYVELSYSGDVICAVRGDGNIQCFQTPSAALAPATGLGWNNMTAVLTAPSSLCGPLGPHTCISAGGGPYRSISIGNPNAAAKLTVCAIQVSTNMPFCFGGNGYVTQLPNLQPAFQSAGMTGLPVSALQQVSGLFFGTALWGRLMNGTQVAELYTATGPADQSQLWQSAACATFRCVRCTRHGTALPAAMPLHTPHAVAAAAFLLSAAAAAASAAAASARRVRLRTISPTSRACRRGASPAP